MTYTAGWNKPGYLPEVDVAEFDSFVDARSYIADILLAIHENPDEPDAYAMRAGEILNYWLPTEDNAETDIHPDIWISPQLGGYVYWINHETGDA